VSASGYEDETNMGSSFRWNDGEAWDRHGSALPLRAGVPAFAGMTAMLFAGD